MFFIRPRKSGIGDTISGASGGTMRATTRFRFLISIGFSSDIAFSLRYFDAAIASIAIVASSDGRPSNNRVVPIGGCS
jgi:hypothetical protein